MVLAASIASALVSAAPLLPQAAAARAPDDPVLTVHVTGLEKVRGPRVLCVVAHPDDEIAFGGTVYKIATHLGGAVDIVVITNGEAGYKYSLLAERLYDKRLTDPEVGRRELPKIRRAEVTESARVLGVRDLYFLNQQDHKYTTDADEVLAADADVWDLDLIRRVLDERLAAGDYDFVFGHLPSLTTHGHHQAATIQALEAVARMAPGRRPVVLGSFGSRTDFPQGPDMQPNRPVTRHSREVGPFVFDRLQKFGFRERLDYRVITNLAMAQHRSQGAYLMALNRGERESFVLFALHAPDAARRAKALFERLAEPQFAPLDYDEDGNLIRAHVR